MLTAAEIKYIKSLKEKKFRDESGLFVVEGEKMVAEALASDFKVRQVLRVEDVGENAMSRISGLSTPPGVLAVVEQKKQQSAELSDGICLALDSVRDPGNMGTIIRIADWFGVKAIYCSRDCVEIYNPKVVQASMGSIFRANIISCDLVQLCSQFRAAGKRVYGTFLDGSNIYENELNKEGLIVMGNESNGISPAVGACVDARVLIPSFGDSGAESLNVGVATAVVLSEFRRR